MRSAELTALERPGERSGGGVDGRAESIPVEEFVSVAFDSNTSGWSFRLSSSCELAAAVILAASSAKAQRKVQNKPQFEEIRSSLQLD